MSLLALVKDPLDYFRPSLIMNQHFGMGLDEEDLLQPCVPRRIRRMLLTSPYTRNWRSLASKKDKGSTVSIDNDKFQVSLDVQQFSPEEITVKASEDTITVEGKHEEKEDEHGCISRHFVRKYKLPEGHNLGLVESKLSSDGVLTITAPKNEVEELTREIPIAITGEPTKATLEIGTEDENLKKVDSKRDKKRNRK